MSLNNEELQSAREVIMRMLEEATRGIICDVCPDEPVFSYKGNSGIESEGPDHNERSLQAVNNPRCRETIAACTAALRRLDNETYGICCKCKEDIPIARLKAMPTAPFCFKCTTEKPRYVLPRVGGLREQTYIMSPGMA